MRRAVILIAVILTSCAASPAEASPAASSPAPSATEPAETASHATSSAEPSDAASLPPIASVLPTHLGDFELHTFETGRDSLLRLAEELGVDPGELEFAFASEHGERFVQMTAIRVRGTSARDLGAAWAQAGFTPDVDDVEVSEEMIDDEPVTVVSSSSAGARIGTFYLVERDETLIVIQAFDREIVEEAIAALP